ncbi:MAG: preprotein translocase subunit SecE [Bacilli bacterium]
MEKEKKLQVKDAKKDSKNIKKKESSKKVKKVAVNKESYFTQVRKELKLVKWPTFKEVAKYSVATIVFCLVVCGFFMLLTFGMSIIKGMFL